MIFQLYPEPDALIYIWPRDIPQGSSRIHQGPLGQLGMCNGRLRFAGDLEQSAVVFAVSIVEVYGLERIQIGIGFDNGKEFSWITFQPLKVEGNLFDEHTRSFLTRFGEILEGMKAGSFQTEDWEDVKCRTRRNLEEMNDG